jgi:hypothetical protein
MSMGAFARVGAEANENFGKGGTVRSEREGHDEAVFSNSPMHEVANIAPRFLPVILVHVRVIP